MYRKEYEREDEANDTRERGSITMINASNMNDNGEALKHLMDKVLPWCRQNYFIFNKWPVNECQHLIFVWIFSIVAWLLHHHPLTQSNISRDNGEKQTEENFLFVPVAFCLMP